MTEKNDGKSAEAGGPYYWEKKHEGGYSCYVTTQNESRTESLEIIHDFLDHVFLLPHC